MPPVWAVPRADLRRLSPSLVGGALALQLVAAAGALAGPWAVTPPLPGPTPPPAPVLAAAAPLRAEPVPSGPVRLAAPDLWRGDVEARPLGLDADGALQVPATADGLGWWADGPRPGEPGAAVVVGHVDLRGELGVFGRLATARPGTMIVVSDARGNPVRFRVVRVDRYDKGAFPTDVVYAPTERPELRLVTCGGRFDPRTGHYADNVVVTAVRA